MAERCYGLSDLESVAVEYREGSTEMPVNGVGDVGRLFQEWDVYLSQPWRTIFRRGLRSNA